jgi:hypothetical protein
MSDAAQPKPGDVEWLKARIVEHRQAEEQAKGQANAHSGAAQAYERLLKEVEKQDEIPVRMVDAA